MAGSHNAVYGLIDWVEESMEMIGASLFLFALLDDFAGASGGLELSFSGMDGTSDMPECQRGVPASIYRGTAVRGSLV